jgi:hypothetical protein
MAEEDIQIEETVGTAPEAVTTVIDEEDNLIAGEPLPEEGEQENFYANLAEKIDEQELKKIGAQLVTEVNYDRTSREDWVQGYVKGLDLLGFKYQSLTRPFIGASGVTHPLLAESVTQFQAQAIKELLPSSGPVRTEVIGAETEEKIQQAQRVKDFMNYMLMDKMEEYTPDFDQMLFYLPLAGSAFKKVYYDELMQRAVSKFIPAEDLVVPYNATDLQDAQRITQVVKMNLNELKKMQITGMYLDIDLPKPYYSQSDAKDKVNELEGISPTPETAEDMYNLIEVHTFLDLPGYEEEGNIKVPYIVTIDEDSQQVLSIYRNYNPDDPIKKRKNYFVHFKFLPGLGFYGFGLIHMIGGLSRTATSALRQLLDAGTLSNLPAGFKSRGMRIRDDSEPLQPGEFRDVDMSQQAPVGTTMALLERGSKVMSAIHKRCYYAMKQEFKILAQVFADYLPPEYPYDVYGGERTIKAQDFDKKVDVIPVADPDIFSMTQRIQVAQAELQLAQTNPQMHNIHEAYRRMYEALGVKNINGILKPPPEPPRPLDPAIENTGALQMVLPKAFPQQDHDAHIATHMAFMMSRMVQINPQVYALLQGHLMEHVSLKIKQQVLADFQNDPAMLQLQQSDEDAFAIEFDSEVAKRQAKMTQELAQMETQFDAQKGQDPLIGLKQRELDLKAMDIQRKAVEEAKKMNFERNKFSAQQTLQEDKLNLNEELGKKRINLAEAKLKQDLKKPTQKKE